MKDPAMKNRKVKGRDIGVIDLTIPRDRRHPITLFYSVNGRGQPAISVAAGSKGGKVIVELCDMVAKRHNKDNS